MFRSNSRTTASGLVVALALLAAAPARADAADWLRRGPKFEAGQIVRFEGQVVGADGEPMAGADVAIDGWRRSLDLRAFSMEKEDQKRLVARTDAEGRFAIDWTWDPRLKKFAVSAFVTYRGDGGVEVTHDLAREEVTGRLREGSPVASRLEVTSDNQRFLERLHDFVAALATADERSTYEQLGLPEQVDRTPRADGVETAWWYFRQGRVCRFLDGARTEIQTFPPVGESGGSAR